MNVFATNVWIFAQASAKAAKQQAADEPSLLSPWMTLLLVMAVLAIPFVLGEMIARGLKMKDQGKKISVILLALELGLAPFVAQYVIGALEQRRYQRELETWETKQAARDKITKADLDALEKAVPGLKDSIQFDPQVERAAAKKPKPKPEKTADKTDATKTPAKSPAKTPAPKKTKS